MFKKIILTGLIVLGASCAKPVVKEIPTSKEYFPEMAGCFLLYNVKTNTFDKVIGEEFCKQQLPACSTFKVPLAVMAFDAKILKDENSVLKWDGKKGARPELNHDHSAQSWMKDSVVWYSQRITPKLGRKKFQKYLNDFDYGNKDLSGGITTAWLTSPSSEKGALKISAYEQVEFMKKLWSEKLPASPKAIQLTKKITFLENSPKGFKLSGKTGSNFYDKEHKVNLGWFISHIENADQEYIVVTNFRDLAPTDKGYGGPRAKQMTKDILKDNGLW